MGARARGSERRTRRWCSGWIVAALLMAAAPGRAQLRLRWQAPAEGDCPSGREVEAEVRRLVGTEPAAVYEAVAEVRFEARWRLTLRAGGGERELEADSCRALGEAAALILALALDPELEVPMAEDGVAPEAPLPGAAVGPAEPPEALGAPPPPGGNRPPGDGTAADGLAPDNPRRVRGASGGDGSVSTGPDRGRSEPSPADASPTEASPAEALPEASPEDASPEDASDQASEGAASASRRSSDAGPRPRPAVFAGASLEFGSLPSLAPGFELGVELPVGRRGRLGLGALGLLPKRTRVDEARATLWLFGLRAALGYALDYGPLRLQPFATAELGLMGGRARGVSRPLVGWTAWLAAGAGLEVAVRLGARVALGLQGDLRVPLRRPVFVIEGVGEAHQAPPLVGRVSLRLSLRL